MSEPDPRGGQTRSSVARDDLHGVGGARSRAAGRRSAATVGRGTGKGREGGVDGSAAGINLVSTESGQSKVRAPRKRRPPSRAVRACGRPRCAAPSHASPNLKRCASTSGGRSCGLLSGSFRLRQRSHGSPRIWGYTHGVRSWQGTEEGRQLRRRRISCRLRNRRWPIHRVSGRSRHFENVCAGCIR
jgi:hypothetical protein